MTTSKTAHIAFIHLLKVILGLIVVLASALPGFAQELIPPLHNYSSAQYKGASQNWGLSFDKKGNLYAANHEGLLVFDGQRWELFPLSLRSVIRSVYAHNDRVYTGSYKEFGYWKRDAAGKMQYTSLMPLLIDDLQSDEFWEILSFRNAIYFRSFGAVYKYADQEITKIKNVISNKMLVYNDRLLVAVYKKGLFYLNDDGSMEALETGGVLEDKWLVDLVADGEVLWIGARDALYFYDGIKVERFADESLNSALAEYEMNHLLKVSDDQLLFGSVKNGVFQYNIKTASIKNYNRRKGLQNNTVLAMSLKNGTIWLGLDNGIDRFDLASSLQFYTDYSGELGAVYDLTTFHDQFYISSNTGVYAFEADELQMIEGAQGHNWNLEVINNTLYSNHNTGTYKIVDNRFVPVATRTGSFHSVKFPYKDDLVLFGNYTGISIYDAKLDSVRELEQIRFPVKKLVVENATSIWAEHAYEGVFKINLSKDSLKTTSVEAFGRENGKKARSKVFTIQNKVAVVRNGIWHSYNAILDSLVPIEELAAFKDFELLHDDENGYWFLDPFEHALKFTNFKDVNFEISNELLDYRLVKGNEKLLRTEDSIYYIPLKDGFARFDMQSFLQTWEQPKLTPPVVKGFADANKRYILKTTPVIPFKNAKNLTFFVGMPGSDISALHYELTGEGEQQEGVLKNGLLQFQNLGYGEYALRLYAKSPGGKSSLNTVYNFEIQAPWYLSSLMRMLYLLFFLLLAGSLYWVSQLRVKKHKRALEQKLVKEHEDRLRHIDKENLKNEIMLKRKELANTTMMAAKKNEVLMDIQGELNKDKDKFSNQYRLKHIMNKINRAIKNKDEWQVFETNFAEVHEDFFKELLQKYPQLSSKDLKLCSYLKMNLTSKEIAPLMGKSVRGVEVHRYRLRKKIRLNSNQHLTSFLIKNF